MKIAKVRTSQCLYLHADNRSDDILQLQTGDVILYDNTFCYTFDEHARIQCNPGILRSWPAIFNGHVGWISCWDSDVPRGIEEISEFAT